MNYLAIILFVICFTLYGFVIAKKINYIRVVDQTLIAISVIGIGNYFYFKNVPIQWQLVFILCLVIMRFAWIKYYGDRGGIYIYNATKIEKDIKKIIKKHSDNIELNMKYRNQINYVIKKGKKEALGNFLKELNDYISKHGKPSWNEYTVVIMFIVLFVVMFI